MILKINEISIKAVNPIHPKKYVLPIKIRYPEIVPTVPGISGAHPNPKPEPINEKNVFMGCATYSSLLSFEKICGLPKIYSTPVYTVNTTTITKI